MNYKVLLLCLPIFYFFACTNIHSEKDLYGIWVGKKGNVKIVLKFNQDSTCEFAYKDSGSNIMKITGDFEVDFSKKPIPLTIRNIPQLNHPLHTIIWFIGSDMLRMAEFAPRWRLRPVAFNRNTEIIFRRN